MFVSRRRLDEALERASMYEAQAQGWMQIAEGSRLRNEQLQLENQQLKRKLDVIGAEMDNRRRRS